MGMGAGEHTDTRKKMQLDAFLSLLFFFHTKVKKT